MNKEEEIRKGKKGNNKDTIKKIILGGEQWVRQLVDRKDYRIWKGGCG